MDTLEQKFCESFAIWKAENFNGTQTELGEMFGVSQGQINKLIAGDRAGKESWRRMIAKKIGIPYDEMVGLREPSSPESTPETKTEVELESELETGEDGEMIDSQKKTISLLEKQVDSLEGDKKRMLATIEKLEAKVDKLEAKKERLEEKLEGIQGAMEHGQIQRPVNE